MYKVAFLVGEFPSISETFILNQIVNLIDKGYTIDIYATKPKSGEFKKHEVIDQYKLLDKVFYFPLVPQNYFKRLLYFIYLFFKYFFSDPKLIVRSLGFKHSEEIKDIRLYRSLRIFYSTIPFLGQRPYYDVFHCHHGSNGLLGIHLKSIGAFQGGIITTFHGYDINVLPLLLGRDVYQDLFKKSTYVTVNSNFTKNKVIHFGCPEDRIVKLPVGLKISEYQYQPRVISENDTINIVTVARLVEKKGIEYSVQAVSNVLKQYPNICYRIIGDGPLRNSIDILIKQLGLSGKIQLLGARSKEEVLEYYKMSHVFLLSSVTAANGDQEGQGLVLQEAQSLGLPVLSTIHNGFKESILDGISGFLVPEKDVEALSRKLINIIENPKAWPSMGLSGHNFVKANFDIDSLNNVLIDLYKNVCESCDTT